jgi:uncharacterized hydrophobic protein (TIGR00341 family)
MPLRLIEVFAASGHFDTIEAIAHRFDALNFSVQSSGHDGVDAFRILARPEKQQELIDQLQGTLGKDKPWRIAIMPVEATIPELAALEKELRSPEQTTREELYAAIERDARIDSTFLLLVLLSTVVAAIGLLEDNLAGVIAAMLIAPLLGPNIAMAFGSTLGDRELFARAAVTNAVGVGLSIAGAALSIAGAALAGLVLPLDTTSTELMARTRLDYATIVLALASGAAGALSVTTRLQSTLVGVMVAVALLPPAVACGYMLGAFELRLAAGAAALLAVNIVCVNLSAQLVFFAKGIKPRNWIERRAAQQSVAIGVAIAAGLLAVLTAIVYFSKS